MSLTGRIGDYEIVKHIGSGAMGDVYQATDAGMFGRSVAIKLLSEKLTGNETAQERFHREVEVATRLEHENIVTIYGRGVHGGREYFVMEYIDGEDLHGLIRKPDARTLEEKLDIARQICEALDFAHSHGVVHRDIKPSNIMVTRRANHDQIKLLDFGIVHVKRSDLTRITTQPGTYSYMSPEQIRNSDVDYRSDLFSLGIVLYELFTGVHPFASSSEVRIAARIDQDEPDPPRKAVPDLPSQLDTILLRLLEKEPAQRPQSAGDVAEALRGVLRKITRGAVSDHSDFTNLDEMTQQMVNNLLTWGRQKEVEGIPEEALRTYQTAAQLAPESELIKGKVSKLKHRIEIDKKLKILLTQAREVLAAGRIGEARSLWNDAWLLAPGADEVVELEERIRKAESDAPDDRERREFVDTGMLEAESALDRGDLSAAFSKLRDIRTHYPDEERATTLWNLVVAIKARRIPYKEFRETLRAAQAALAERRFAAARQHLAELKELWPDAKEVAALEAQIEDHFGSAVRGLIAEADVLIKGAQERDVDPDRGLESLQTAVDRLERAQEMGADEGWIAEPRKQVRALTERLQVEQDRRTKAVEGALLRARESLGRAEASSEEPGRDPRTVLALFQGAQKGFEDLLTLVPKHAEAVEVHARIHSQIEALQDELRRHEKVARLDAEALQRADLALAEALPLAGGTEEELERCLSHLQSAKAPIEEALGRSPTHEKARQLREEIDRRIGEVLQHKEDRRRRTETLALQVSREIQQGRALLAGIQSAPSETIPQLHAISALFPEAEASAQQVLATDPGHSEALQLREELATLRQDLAHEIERRDRIFRALLVEGRDRLPKLDTIDSMDLAAVQDALIWLEAAREPIDGALQANPESAEALELARLLVDGLDRASKRKLHLEKPPVEKEKSAPPPPPPPPTPTPPSPIPVAVPESEAARIPAILAEAGRRHDEAKSLGGQLDTDADRMVELLTPARKSLDEVLRLKPGHTEAKSLRQQISQLLATATPKASVARLQRTQDEFRAEIAKVLALAQSGQKKQARAGYEELDRRCRAYEELHPLMPELGPLVEALKGGSGIPWTRVAAVLGVLAVAAVVVFVMIRPSPPPSTQIPTPTPPPTQTSTQAQPPAALPPAAPVDFPREKVEQPREPEAPPPPISSSPPSALPRQVDKPRVVEPSRPRREEKSVEPQEDQVLGGEKNTQKADVDGSEQAPKVAEMPTVTAPEVQLGQLTGLLCDPETRRPLLNKRFQVLDANNNAKEDLTNEEGEFSIAVAPGRYRFGVTDSKDKLRYSSPPEVVGGGKPTRTRPFKCR